MHASAALLELRTERHLLGEGMFECVFRNRIKRLLVDELVVLESLQRGGEGRIRDLGDGFEDRLGKLLADHRRSLQHLFILVRQSVDAGGEHRLNRARNLESLDRGDESVVASVPGEVAGFDQRLHDLFGKEWIARGALVDRPGETLDADIVAQQVGEQVANCVGTQGQ